MIDYIKNKYINFKRYDWSDKGYLPCKSFLTDLQVYVAYIRKKKIKSIFKD